MCVTCGDSVQQAAGTESATSDHISYKVAGATSAEGVFMVFCGCTRWFYFVNKK